MTLFITFTEICQDFGTIQTNKSLYICMQFCLLIMFLQVSGTFKTNESCYENHVSLAKTDEHVPAFLATLGQT